MKVSKGVEKLEVICHRVVELKGDFKGFSFFL
jgi:hypothetical protein